MIFELEYTGEYYTTIEQYLNCNTFKSDDCIIYFYVGTTKDQFCKDWEYCKLLESRFKININWIDLSYIYQHLPDYSDKADVDKVINSLKNLWKNHAYSFIHC